MKSTEVLLILDRLLSDGIGGGGSVRVPKGPSVLNSLLGGSLSDGDGGL